MLSLWDFHQELGRAVSHPSCSLPSTKELQDLRYHLNCHSWCLAVSKKRSEEHTSELQSHLNLVCRLLLEKKKLNLYDTWTRTKRPFLPLDPDNLRMHVCVQTFAVFAHIGKARPVSTVCVLFSRLLHLAVA